MPSESGKQHRAMEAAAHGTSTLGIPKKVGEEFAGADKGKTFRDRIDSACARLDSICARMDGVRAKGTKRDYDNAFEKWRHGLGPKPNKLDYDLEPKERKDAASDTGREIESLDRQYDALVKEFRQAQADLKRSKSSKNAERFNSISERMDKMADRLRDLRDRHQKEARAEQRSAGNAKLKEQGGKQGSLFDSTKADAGGTTYTVEAYRNGKLLKSHKVNANSEREARDLVERNYYGAGARSEGKASATSLKIVGGTRADSGSATLTRLVEASARMDGIARRMDALGVRADAGPPTLKPGDIVAGKSTGNKMRVLEVSGSQVKVKSLDDGSTGTLNISSVVFMMSGKK